MYDCDALKPTAQRYASQRYRRAHSLFFHDWDEAVELVAFVESIGGVLFAKRIFQWTGHAYVQAYADIRAQVLDAAQPYIRANRAEFGVDHGLAVLGAMRDGGWRRGRMPWVVKHALKTLRKSGWTIAKIARETGLSREQVKTGCDVRLGERKIERIAAFASLGMGTKSFSGKQSFS